MKKYAIVLSLVFVLMFSSLSYGATYSDVKSGEWYYQAVTSLSNAKIINGYGNGTFKPNNNINRAEFVRILARASGDTISGRTSGFSDVPSSHWAYQDVAWAVEKNITAGRGNNQFAPSGLITREEMVTMIYRYFVYKGTAPGITISPVYSDFSSISGYAQDPVKALYGYGGINGVGDNKFAPKNKATRAQAAQIIYNNLFLNARQRTTIFAQNFTGWKYAVGGSNPQTGFDNTGFVKYVYGQFGVALDGDAAAMATFGSEVSKAGLNMGDMVYFGGNSPHVGIYIGSGKFIHAVKSSNTADKVYITSMNSSYYSKNFICGRRLFNQ